MSEIFDVSYFLFGLWVTKENKFGNWKWKFVAWNFQQSVDSKTEKAKQ